MINVFMAIMLMKNRIRNMAVSMLPLLMAAACADDTTTAGHDAGGSRIQVAAGLGEPEVGTRASQTVKARGYTGREPSESNPFYPWVWFSATQGDYSTADAAHHNKVRFTSTTLTFPDNDISYNTADATAPTYCIGLYPSDDGLFAVEDTNTSAWTAAMAGLSQADRPQGTIISAEIDGSQDLLFAPEVSGSLSSRFSTGSNRLQFSHLLTWLKIRVSAATAGAGEAWGDVMYVKVASKNLVRLDIGSGKIYERGPATDDVLINAFAPDPDEQGVEGKEQYKQLEPTIPEDPTVGNVLVVPARQYDITYRTTAMTAERTVTVQLKTLAGDDIPNADFARNRVFVVTLSFGERQKVEASCMLVSMTDNEDNLYSEGKDSGEGVTWDNGATRAAINDVAGNFQWQAADRVAYHTTAGWTTSGAAGTNGTAAEFAVSGALNGFAVYPVSLVHDGSAWRTASVANYGGDDRTGTLTVTLPGSYELADVAGTRSPTPMIAINYHGGWIFRQLCGLLRVTVNNIPAGTTALTLDFHGHKVQGQFSIASPVPGTSTIAGSATTGTDDIITVNGLEGAASCVLNIPLPTGTYSDITILPVGSSVKAGAVRHIRRTGARRTELAANTYTVTRAHGIKLTTTLVAFDGMGGGKVLLSPGNLRAYAAGAATAIGQFDWSFAPAQYSAVGTLSANQKVTGALTLSGGGWFDLFGFAGSGTAHYGIHNNNTTMSIYGTAYNTGSAGTAAFDLDATSHWANRPVGDYAAGEWTVPTAADFAAFLAAGNMGRAVVYDGGEYIPGIVVRPATGWTDPGVTVRAGAQGSTLSTGATTTYGTAGSYPSTATNYYTIDTWAAMEDAGAVFMPASGYRTGTTIVRPEGGDSFYQTATAYDANRYYCFRFDGTSLFNPNHNHDRHYGGYVRLIKRL